MTKKVNKLLLDDAGLKAEDTLFIDDTLMHVEGARKAGIVAQHLTDGQTILDLNFASFWS